LSTFAIVNIFLNHSQPPSTTLSTINHPLLYNHYIYASLSHVNRLKRLKTEEKNKREERVQCVSRGRRESATVRVKECRFERKTECKSETLGFVGLYWVELSVCIIPPLIYNLLPPWTYPVLGNHVNLLVCVLFVFAFGPVCTTNWYQSIREA
jgi:hypothetical protein